MKRHFLTGLGACLALGFAMQASAAVPVIPSWAAEKVAQTGDVVIHTGTLDRKTPTIKIPIRFRTTLKLKTDLKMVGPFDGKNGGTLVAPAGTLGYSSGSYAAKSGEDVTELKCFFYDRSQKAVSYALPVCVMDNDRTEVGKDIPLLQVLSYIPKEFRDTAYAVVPKPEIEVGDFTIDHSFSLNLAVAKWMSDCKPIKTCVEVWWSMEGRLISKELLPAPDGVVRFSANGGTITLSPDATDTRKTLVSFAAD